MGDTIYVSSHINAVPYLALAMEQCWLSNTSKVLTHASDKDKTLVTRGCPTTRDISLHWEKGSSNSAFSFQVSPKLNDGLEFSIYVMIRSRRISWELTSSGSSVAWVCAQRPMQGLGATFTGNDLTMITMMMIMIHRCVNPELDCVREHEHQESSLQQISIRGPLHIIPVTRNTLEKRQRPILQEKIATGARGEADMDLTTQASHTLVEVPVEVAVAIALASFIVGAMSTGVLWFLHSKAMQAKAVSVPLVKF